MVPQISKTANYSVVDDFEPIAITGLVPVVLIVSKNIKADNLKDFIAEVRANPGKYTYGGGVGSPPHIMGAWMNKIRGLNVTHIPYRGGAQGITDVVGGHIDMFYGGVAVGKGGDRRRLGQGARGDRRHALRGAAERADLQGGRRAGVRSGELDRACWRRRARRRTSSTLIRKETLSRARRPRDPRRAGAAGRRAEPTARTCGRFSRTSGRSSAAPCTSSASPWGNNDDLDSRFLLCALLLGVAGAGQRAKLAGASDQAHRADRSRAPPPT